jgi:hypothetical protein
MGLSCFAKPNPARQRLPHDALLISPAPSVNFDATSQYRPVSVGLASLHRHDDVTEPEKRSVGSCVHEMSTIPGKISKVDNTNTIHLWKSPRNPIAKRHFRADRKCPANRDTSYAF